MANKFYTGDLLLLYLDIGNGFVPVGCLTQNGINEESDSIVTTTRENASWESSRPTLQRYSITFSGLCVKDLLGASGMYSIGTLKAIKRNRIIAKWLITTLQGEFTESGECYISSLADSAPVGDFYGFQGTLTGVGPINDTETLDLVIQDGLLNTIDPTGDGDFWKAVIT